MEAREKELKFLATEGKVIIPFFQRTYVWKQENWENLLEGLISKPDGHFLGSIILKQIRVNVEGHLNSSTWTMVIPPGGTATLEHHVWIVKP